MIDLDAVVAFVVYSILGNRIYLMDLTDFNVWKLCFRKQSLARNNGEVHVLTRYRMLISIQLETRPAVLLLMASTWGRMTSPKAMSRQLGGTIDLVMAKVGPGPI